MVNIALVAAGGAIGSVFRYLVGVLSVRLAGLNFPWERWRSMWSDRS